MSTNNIIAFLLILYIILFSKLILWMVKYM